MSLLSPTKPASNPALGPAPGIASAPGGESEVPAATPASPTPRLLAALREDLAVVVARDPPYGAGRKRSSTRAHRAVGAPRRSPPARSRLRIPARLLARWARRVTAVEIHPGAVLGRRVFIDHGAGVVIGRPPSSVTT